MKNITIIALAVLLVLAGVVSYISYSAANSLVHSPHEKALDLPENYGYTNYENVVLPAGDDPKLRLKVWYFPPLPEKNGATVIHVHGFRADCSWLLSQARFMSDEGYGALLLDLHNSGESDGNTTCFGEKEWHDVEGAVNYLNTRPEVNMNLLGVMGRSMGGCVVIRSQVKLQLFNW